MGLVSARGLGYQDGYQGRPCEVPEGYGNEESDAYLYGYADGSIYRTMNAS